MRKKLVAAKWKMHFTWQDVEAYIRDFKKIYKPHEKREVVIAAPFVYLKLLTDQLQPEGVKISAQNMHWEDFGAFTGEISAPMLKSIGVETVILGHSERRMYFGETGEILKRKVDKAVEHVMQVIFCVGEKLPEREAGKHFETVRLQLEKSVFHLGVEDWKNMVIAYEPVWAIGTGKTATPDQAQEMHAFIRRLIHEKYGEKVAEATRILYGGSVKPANAAELFSRPDVDGGLVGGASLVPDQFMDIIRVAG